MTFMLISIFCTTNLNCPDPISRQITFQNYLSFNLLFVTQNAYSDRSILRSLSNPLKLKCYHIAMNEGVGDYLKMLHC